MSDVEVLSKIVSLKAHVLRIPQELHIARLALAETIEAAKAAREVLAEYEAETLALVRAEREDDGKVIGLPGQSLVATQTRPKYPNDETRKAAVTLILTTSPEYAVRKKAASTADRARTTADMRVKQLEDQQRALAYVADLTVAEVRLLTAGK